MRSILNSASEIGAPRPDEISRLTLTPEQVTSLTQIANSRTAEHRQVQRARFLRKALQIGPMMALEDLKRSGRPATISDDARTWVRSLACTPPKDLPDGPTQALWSMETLAVYVRKHAEEPHFGDSLGKASKSTIWTILEEGEIKPHRIRYYLEKKDPDFEAKAQEVLLLYKRVEIDLRFIDTLEGVIATREGLHAS